MEFNEMIGLFIVHIVCCIMGIFATYKMYRWNLRSKIVAFFLAGSIIFYLAAGYLVYNDFSLYRIALAGVVLAVVSTALVGWLMNALIRPILEINTCLDALINGDFTQTIGNLSQDELGDIARKLNKMISEITLLISAIKESSSENLKMAEKLSEISKQLSDSAADTAKKTTSVASSAEEMSMMMKGVAAAMEQASSNIGMVVTAAEQTTATMNEIAQNSEKAHTITGKAVLEARQASGNVGELDNATQNISKITEAINEISEQTNLLALNATIEASRAGEAGKGFAVVAGEIKELARQTADSTFEIKKTIEGIWEIAGKTISEIENIAGVITEGDDLVSAIASAIEEQSITTQEISNNVLEASNGIQEVNNNIAQSLLSSEHISMDISQANQDANKMSLNSTKVNESASELSAIAQSLMGRAEKFVI